MFKGRLRATLLLFLTSPTESALPKALSFRPKLRLPKEGKAKWRNLLFPRRSAAPAWRISRGIWVAQRFQRCNNWPIMNGL
ncbi:MAG: hypothetical protein JWQ87_350 [Candidatus Sulfotelmatobacter sp.]|nr:hypothetical protein [Candidatus Sulfotelmatobacter sp.]